MTYYKFKTKDLCKWLGVTRMTIYNWEQRGLFNPPRNMRGDRVFSLKQLQNIQKAFSPGGKGKWYFNK